ncbi:MAG: LysR family transcriptional regulator [Chloracidobacterium sp.]|nr:LysR family transcriptional regulator [Chloracidobacterium sp.]MCC6825086.1 LysR family transcriptional regulator [Acidobacteriota bacterium]MCO5334778.1 LysR family transcriptional regulator [Pyrinomonadaceae bacterium]
MNLDTLKVFCDLVDLESFSLAAERNFITQSAVSQQIRALEKKFNKRLLERVRGRREVKLTGAGEVFYRESKKVLAAYGEMQENMRGAVGRIGGTVRVATIYSVGLYELPAKVREFMTKYPAAKIDLEYLRTTKVVRDVLDGKVELGVIAFPEPKRGLTIVPMPENRLVVIAPPGHPLSKRKELKVTDLSGEDLVHFQRDMPTRKMMERTFKQNGIEVRKVAEFDNIETIKRAVEAGFGLAVVPEPSVIEEQRNNALAVIRLAEDYWKRSVGVIHRSDKSLSLAAKKFIKLLEKPAE